MHRIERYGEPGILIADYVTPPMAEKLKAKGIAFLDAAGNAFLDQPPVYVWVKGERPTEQPAATTTTGRAFRPGGLKVLFALLCHPEWIDRPYREIAAAAGVAHGTVGWVMMDLQKLGFAAEIDGKRRLLQRDRLLQQWTEAYARTLRPKLVLQRFQAEYALAIEDALKLTASRPLAASSFSRAITGPVTSWPSWSAKFVRCATRRC